MTFKLLPSVDSRMMLVEKRALRLAACDETILLIGETGVGKDVLAHRIHDASPRAERAFVQINCAALPEGLVESELFGHVRGAYTGAIESQPGQFEMASGGTIFLDEIGELSLPLQAKLLNVLDKKGFYRVGGRSPLTPDVRILAATNRNLKQAVKRREFRPDLYYRISVICLRVPPLRERPADVDSLARFFAKRYASLYNKPALAEMSEDVLAAMRRHSFAGNIRELENMIKGAILFNSYDWILDNLREWDDSQPSSMSSDDALFRDETPSVGVQRPLKEVTRQSVQRSEREAIFRALSTVEWNRRKASRLLGISYRSLLYKIRDYGIRPLLPDPVVPEEGRPEWSFGIAGDEVS